MRKKFIKPKREDWFEDGVSYEVAWKAYGMAMEEYIQSLEKQLEELRIANMTHEYNEAEADRHWPDIKKQIEEDAIKPYKQEIQRLKKKI